MGNFIGSCFGLLLFLGLLALVIRLCWGVLKLITFESNKGLAMGLLFAVPVGLIIVVFDPFDIDTPDSNSTSSSISSSTSSDPVIIVSEERPGDTDEYYYAPWGRDEETGVKQWLEMRRNN
tara:strand:+ start:166 stop:528 length:363 start_codon:yes stop_codon:yes gene_type:complete